MTCSLISPCSKEASRSITRPAIAPRLRAPSAAAATFPRRMPKTSADLSVNVIGPKADTVSAGINRIGQDVVHDVVGWQAPHDAVCLAPARFGGQRQYGLAIVQAAWLDDPEPRDRCHAWGSPLIEEIDIRALPRVHRELSCRAVGRHVVELAAQRSPTKSEFLISMMLPAPMYRIPRQSRPPGILSFH